MASKVPPWCARSPVADRECVTSCPLQLGSVHWCSATSLWAGVDAGGQRCLAALSTQRHPHSACLLLLLSQLRRQAEALLERCRGAAALAPACPARRAPRRPLPPPCSPAPPCSRERRRAPPCARPSSSPATKSFRARSEGVRRRRRVASASLLAQRVARTDLPRASEHRLRHLLLLRAVHFSFCALRRASCIAHLFAGAPNPGSSTTKEVEVAMQGKGTITSALPGMLEVRSRL